MSEVLSHSSVERVRAALDAAGIRSEVIELPGAARTAKAAAEFLGCEVGQIANSLVFRAASSNRPILVMSSGAQRVDTTRLAQLLGEPVAKADAGFVRDKTGFAIGGVAPAGHIAPIEAYVDRSLAGYGEIWAAGGHPRTVFRMSYRQLLLLTRGAEASLAA